MNINMSEKSPQLLDICPSGLYTMLWSKASKNLATRAQLIGTVSMPCVFEEANKNSGLGPTLLIRHRMGMQSGTVYACVGFSAGSAHIPVLKMEFC